jgi:hypothetical protein
MGHRTLRLFCSDWDLEFVASVHPKFNVIHVEMGTESAGASITTKFEHVMASVDGMLVSVNINSSELLMHSGKPRTGKRRKHVLHPFLGKMSIHRVQPSFLCVLHECWK